MKSNTNNNRDDVIDFIKKNPKTSSSELARIFKVKAGTAAALKAHYTRGTYDQTQKLNNSQHNKKQELNMSFDVKTTSRKIGEENKDSKRANELDGKTWLKYSISVWNDIRKTKDEWKINHPAMFPEQLPSRLIEMFTNENMKVVLDPFLGTGSTLVAAMRLNKEGIGFEIADEYISVANKRFKNRDLFSSNIKPKVYKEDARNILSYIEKESVDVCITSPPYWDILSEKRTADNKDTRDYSEQENNIGNIGDYEEFLTALNNIFEKIYLVLKPGAYCCIIVMDIRKKNKFYPYHSDIAKFMQEIGFIYDDLIIWDRRSEYSNLRPLGYPYRFRINKIHEYILIFNKERK